MRIMYTSLSIILSIKNVLYILIQYEVRFKTNTYYLGTYIY